MHRLPPVPYVLLKIVVTIHKYVGEIRGGLTKILCECQISKDSHNQPQNASDCSISDNTILITISLFTEL